MRHCDENNECLQRKQTLSSVVKNVLERLPLPSGANKNAHDHGPVGSPIFQNTKRIIVFSETKKKKFDI